MSNFVIKLAQPGFDVKTTGDENLIYSSKWPLLKIYKEGTFVLDEFNSSHTITTHDLGYVPFFWWFANENIDGYIGSGVTRTVQPRSDFHGDLVNGQIRIDANKLFYYATGTTPTGKVQIHYYIFALPILENFVAPQINTGGKGGHTSNSVLKLAKPTKNVDSNRLEDYVIHSNARSPLIHSVTPGVTNEQTSLAGVYTMTVNHNLGYIPMFFGFINDPSDGSYRLDFGAAIIPGLVGFDVSEKQIKYYAVGNLGLSVVVLKDPFNLDYNVDITI